MDQGTANRDTTRLGLTGSGMISQYLSRSLGLEDAMYLGLSVAKRRNFTLDLVFH